MPEASPTTRGPDAAEASALRKLTRVFLGVVATLAVADVIVTDTNMTNEPYPITNAALKFFNLK